jgi:CheY-like chemotaxis protein
MTQPLALVAYERLLPGTQLVNRLQDLRYRVQVVTDAEALVVQAKKEKPMVVLADLVSSREDVCAVIGRLKQDRETQHIPVIAFTSDETAQLQAAARQAGATLVVSDGAIVGHLPQFLEQALQVE